MNKVLNMTRDHLITITVPGAEVYVADEGAALPYEILGTVEAVTAEGVCTVRWHNGNESTVTRNRPVTERPVSELEFLV